MRGYRTSRRAERRRSRQPRGVTLIEVMSTTMLLAMTVLMGLAMFPLSRFLQDRSGGMSTASAILQRKLEQIRRLDASRLNTTGLSAAGYVDPGSTGSALSFTSQDRVSEQLRGGAGVLTLTGAGSDLVRVDVTVSWTEMRGLRKQVVGSTYVADKSIWREP